MPDNLHTRIAAVQRAHRLNSFGANYVQCECGWKSPEKYATWTDHPEHVADAVIHELDLGIPCATNGCRMRQITKRSHRSAEKLGLIGDGKTADE